MKLSLGVNAGACIAHGQQDIAPRWDFDALVVRGLQCHVTRRDGETPTLWHGIFCVHRQVHDDLLNLTSIACTVPSWGSSSSTVSTSSPNKRGNIFSRSFTT